MEAHAMDTADVCMYVGHHQGTCLHLQVYLVVVVEFVGFECRW